jgi:hypothetical protein
MDSSEREAVAGAQAIHICNSAWTARASATAVI